MAKLFEFAPVTPTSRYNLRHRADVVCASEARKGSWIEAGLVISIEPGSHRSKDKLTFLCLCGSISQPARRDNLKSGHTKSCSHLRATWAKIKYSEMTEEERADLFNLYHSKGAAAAAAAHDLPKFVIDFCRRFYVGDLLDDVDLVKKLRKVVNSASRFADGIRRAARYFHLSVYAVRAVYALSKDKSATITEAPVRLELSAEARIIVTRAIEGLQLADDPTFREMTIDEAVDELLHEMHRAAGQVADAVNDEHHLSTREFPTPQTKEFAKSKTVLPWVYKVLSCLTLEAIEMIGLDLAWLLRVMENNISARRRRRKDAMAKKAAGIVPTRNGGALNRFNAPAPGIDSNAAVDLLHAGYTCLDTVIVTAMAA